MIMGDIWEQDWTDGNSNSVPCPWCGEDNSDLWEFALEEDELVETECGWCCKPIILGVYTTIRHQATKDLRRCK